MTLISVTLTGEQWDVCLQALAVAQDRYEEFVEEHEVELAQCLIEEHSKYRDVEHALQVSVANPTFHDSVMAEHQTLENCPVVYTSPGGGGASGVSGGGADYI